MTDRDNWALVFSGGGIRFAVHVGVMDAMWQWRIDGQNWVKRFNVLVGTSAGALYAALHAAGYEPPQIRILSEVLSAPKFRDQLFDKNTPGLAAAYLHYDARDVLGAVRGDSLLRLLEAVFDRDERDELKTRADAALQDGNKRGALGDEIQRAWRAQKEKAAREGDGYYDGQIDFGDAADNGFDLYLIGTNALTGQKTVFCKLREQDADELEDLGLSDDLTTRPPGPGVPPPDVEPLNPWCQVGPEIATREPKLKRIDPTFRLDPRRWRERKYWQFDRKRYGTQLPLALAVRASISIPVVFEPLRIDRPTPADVEKKTGSFQDVFIDGGVDDNLSLTVAAHPDFGDSPTILGIGLSSLGYRLPDADALSGPTSLLMRTLSYMGDAVADFEEASKHLAEARITVLDAVPTSTAGLQDTAAIADLIDEGRGIANEFRDAIEPLPNPRIQEQSVFRLGRERRYLSHSARVGPANLEDALRPNVLTPRPTLVEALWPLPPPNKLRDGAVWALFLTTLIGFAALALLGATACDQLCFWLDSPRGAITAGGTIAAALGAGVVGIIVTRLFALLLAYLREEPVFPAVVHGVALVALWAAIRTGFGAYYAQRYGPVGSEFRLVATPDFAAVWIGALGVAAFVVVYVGLIRFRSLSLADLGWRARPGTSDGPWTWRNVREGVVGFVIYVVFVFALSAVFPELKGGRSGGLAFDPVRLALSLIGAIVLAAWIEETLFRGYLQPLLAIGWDRRGLRLSVGMQAIVFMAAHAGWFSTSPEFFATFVLGLVCGILRARTGSLVAPATAHGLFWITVGLLV